jgi:hypothetical protein
MEHIITEQIALASYAYMYLGLHDPQDEGTAVTALLNKTTEDLNLQVNLHLLAVSIN